MAVSRTRIAQALVDLFLKNFLSAQIEVGTIAATGTVQADAAVLTATNNLVTAADGTKGVVLPVNEPDMSVHVVNTSAVSDLKVYPDLGSTINGAAANAAFVLIAGSEGFFRVSTSGTWFVRAASSSVAGLTASGAELNVLHSVTPGTVAASSAVVVNAASAVDKLRATTELSVGGTGVAGAAAVSTEVTKAVTAFSDTTAKTVFTVTIPNAAHSANIEVDCLGVLGAGGAIGAGESSMSTKYLVNVVRTAGVNAVAGVSTLVGSAKSKVAGADDITSVVVTTAAVAGGVGASNTIDIQVAITRSGAGATNHTGVFKARVLNQNATGVTIA